LSTLSIIPSRIVTLGLVIVLCIVPTLFVTMRRRGLIGAETDRELRRRYDSWLFLAPALLIPILLGAAWTIVGVGILSLLCYREYVRATGLLRRLKYQ
jgi:phosphatidate cytidylyltransferase